MSFSLAVGVYEHWFKKHGDKPEEYIKVVKTKNYLNRARHSYWINTALLAGAIFVQSRVAAGVECSNIVGLQMTVAFYLTVQFITITNITTLFYLLSKAGMSHTNREKLADPFAGSEWGKTFIAVTILTLVGKICLIIASCAVVGNTLSDCRKEGNVDRNLRSIISMFIILIISELVPWMQIYKYTKRLCCDERRKKLIQNETVVMVDKKAEPFGEKILELRPTLGGEGELKQMAEMFDEKEPMRL